MIPVVAGVLRDARGRVLIAQRPPGKIAAGQWEFPGGKIEPGEAPESALRRELQEELGVRAGAMRPLIRLHHRYIDRSIELDTWEVLDFTGTPRGMESQQLAWVAPCELAQWPLLAADGPIVRALELPDYLVVSGDFGGMADYERRVAQLAPRDCLFRLRVPGVDDDTYAGLQECARAHGLRVIADRQQLAARLDAYAWHLRSAELGQVVAPQARCSAACHNIAQIRRAHQLGVDFLVLGPVLTTPSHPEVVALGWERFAELAFQCQVPVYAIGGLRPEDLAAVRAAGGQGVAGIRAFWPGSDPAASQRSGSSS